MSRTFILGGTRSGKSAHAVRLATAQGADAVTFVATARAGDPELDARIALHQRARPESWSTVIAGADLAGAIASAPAEHVVLVDSLTLWVATLHEFGEPIARHWADAEFALDRRGRSIIVSDEIGLGMVPMDASARRFRDDLGWLHQQVARSADEVWLMVAGIPMRMKPARG